MGLGKPEIYTGAALLFSTNLICIIFFGSLVFLFQSYGNIDRAKRGLALSTVIIFLLGLPLTLSMRELVIKQNVRHYISSLIISETTTFANTDIKSIVVVPKKNYLKVEIEIAAPIDSISQNQINLVRNFLADKIEMPIDLEVTVIPIKILKSAN